MANHDSRELRVALLKSVQAFCPEVKSLPELTDGHTLFTILRVIDPEYFAQTSLPQTSRQETSSNWIPRWQNLKYIQKIVAAYTRDVCGELDTTNRVNDEDLKALAIQAPVKSDSEYSFKGAARNDAALSVLLIALFRAATYSPVSNARMTKILVGLGADGANAIKLAFDAMEEGNVDVSLTTTTGQDLSPPPHGPTSLADDFRDPFSSRDGRDNELEQEERMIKAMRTIRQLEDTNAQLTGELEGAKKTEQELHDALETFKYQVGSADSSGETTQLIQDLKSQAKDNREYIADLETDLYNTKATLQTQERQNERLKSESDTKQHLRDEIQLLKAERDELAPKVRAVDNLKKKIQLLQDQERQHATMREDLRAAQDQLQELDTLRERCERLQKVNTETRNIISNTEQEIFDQKTKRQRLEHELKVSQQKVEAARDRQNRDQEIIADLERQVHQSQETGRSTPSSDIQDGLESELQAVEKSRPPLRTLSKDTSAEVEHKVEEALRTHNARVKQLESENLRLLQDNLGLETLVSESNITIDPETHPSYIEQRKRLLGIEEENHKLRRAIFQNTGELASAREKSLSAMSPTIGLSRRGSKFDDNSDAESIATHESLQDVRAEYQALTKSFADLVAHSDDVDNQLALERRLVRHALLPHRVLLAKSPDVRRLDEYRLILEQLKVLSDDGTGNAALVELATSLADKVEAARAAVAKEQKVRVRWGAWCLYAFAQIADVPIGDTGPWRNDQEPGSGERRTQAGVQVAWDGG